MPHAKLFDDLYCHVVLSPHCISLMYNSAILILIYLGTYIWCGLDPSSQATGVLLLLRTPWPEKNDKHGNIFFAESAA